jgi:BolA protein
MTARGPSLLPAMPPLPGVDRAERIRTLLAPLLPHTLEITDDSASHAGHAGARSGGGHYDLLIVADCFAGASRVVRHRMVYAALAPMMQREIHALALRTLAPDEL